MAPRPTAERPPSGLDSYWTHTWDHALDVLKVQGTWEWEQKPLLDEYVRALVAAGEDRELGKAGSWDRHARRAMALADQLLLTPRSRKAHGLYDPVDEDEEPRDGFEALDELAPRRDRSQAA